VSGQQHVPVVLYFRERPGTHCTGGWVGPRLVWTGTENLTPIGIRSPDRPARSSVAIPTELPGPHLYKAEHNSQWFSDMWLRSVINYKFQCSTLSIELQLQCKQQSNLHVKWFSWTIWIGMNLELYWTVVKSTTEWQPPKSIQQIPWIIVSQGVVHRLTSFTRPTGLHKPRELRSVKQLTDRSEIRFLPGSQSHVGRYALLTGKYS
jgi:hypothetical protein